MKNSFKRVLQLTAIVFTMLAQPVFSQSSSISGRMSDDDNWDDRFDALGLNGTVFAIAINGSDVYVAGDFTIAGGVAANKIAKWDGTSWYALGSGVNADARAIAVNGSDVYVGGEFIYAGGSGANHIAKWDGSAWSALGSGINGYVRAIAINGGNIYAGGNFTTAGGTSASNIAMWDGTSWSALGDGLGDAGSWVFAITIIGSNLYAGGEFVESGGIPMMNVARWNGTSWSAMGDGIEATRMPSVGEKYVLSLASDESTVYAGCSAEFSVSEYFDGSNVYYIYYTDVHQWNGSSWPNIGTATDGCTGGRPKIRALAYSGGYLYAGGEFSDTTVLIGDYPSFYTYIPDINTNRVAQWDGSDWSALGSGLNGTVYAMGLTSTKVYVGGEFTQAGGKPSYYFGIYDMSGMYPDMTYIEVPVHYASIQAAINSATDGDTIFVHPGQFDISDPIRNDRVNDLKLWGSRLPDGSNSTLINAIGQPGTFTCVKFQNVNGCEISGFEIRNGFAGLTFENCNECQSISNYIHHNIDVTADDGAGMGIYNSNNIDVESCILYSNEKHGIDIWQSLNIDILQNTILTTTLKDGIYVGAGSDHITVKNTILAYHQNEGIAVHSTPPSNFVHDYNCFWQNGTSLTQGYSIGAHSMESDPLFVDLNNENYFLQSGSPCLGTGEGGVNIGALGEETTDVSDNPATAVTEFQLFQNYPNPFNSTTMISYVVPSASHVLLTVYGTTGTKITTLINEKQPAGKYMVTWQGIDNNGRPMPSGIYFLRLDSGNFVQTRKVLLVR